MCASGPSAGTASGGIGTASKVCCKPSFPRARIQLHPHRRLPRPDDVQRRRRAPLDPRPPPRREILGHRVTQRPDQHLAIRIKRSRIRQRRIPHTVRRKQPHRLRRRRPPRRLLPIATLHKPGTVGPDPQSADRPSSAHHHGVLRDEAAREARLAATRSQVRPCGCGTDRATLMRTERRPDPATRRVREPLLLSSSLPERPRLSVSLLRANRMSVPVALGFTRLNRTTTSCERAKRCVLASAPTAREEHRQSGQYGDGGERDTLPL